MTNTRSLIFLSLACMPIHSWSSDINPRIINGRPAGRSTYPTSVVIVANRLNEHECGGTLISPTLVLTAGHCSEGIIDFVQIGRYNRLNPLEDYESIPIIAERIHPDYDPSSLDFDLQLLQLERPSSTVTDYMPLNSINEMPPIGVSLTAMGWGDTSLQPLVGSTNERSPLLQEVELKYVPNEECDSKETAEDSYVGKIADNMICSFAKDADHCYGDSGGPLLVISPSDPSNVIQVGIISWGANACADGIFPGVAQRVSTSIDWISSWVCAIDGSDPTTQERFGCEEGYTFSPRPTPAPVEPSLSPAPTAYTVTLWIQLFMDNMPGDIRWQIIDKSRGIVVAQSPSYEDILDDVIVENIEVSPGKEYEFVILDTFGDGLSTGGYYQVGIGGSDIDSSTLLFRNTNLQDAARHTFETPERTPAPVSPTATPSVAPSIVTSASPTSAPNPSPSTGLTAGPTSSPSTGPTFGPTPSPSTGPASGPTPSPNTGPTVGSTSSEEVPKCLDVGDVCQAFTECCSERCVFGSCQKSNLLSPLDLRSHMDGGSRGGSAGISRGGSARGGAVVGSDQTDQPDQPAHPGIQDHSRTHVDMGTGKSVSSPPRGGSAGAAIIDSGGSGRVGSIRGSDRQ